MPPSIQAVPRSAAIRIWMTLATLVVIAASAVIVAEIMRLPQFDGPAGREAALTFAAMLASLASVVVSVILPQGAARTALFVGAVGFFGCLAYAIANGVRF